MIKDNNLNLSKEMETTIGKMMRAKHPEVSSFANEVFFFNNVDTTRKVVGGCYRTSVNGVYETHLIKYKKEEDSEFLSVSTIEQTSSKTLKTMNNRAVLSIMKENETVMNVTFTIGKCNVSNIVVDVRTSDNQLD